MKDRAILTVSEHEVQEKAQEAAAGLWERLKSARPQVDIL